MTRDYLLSFGGSVGSVVGLVEWRPGNPDTRRLFLVDVLMPNVGCWSGRSRQQQPSMQILIFSRRYDPPRQLSQVAVEISAGLCPSILLRRGPKEATSSIP